MYGRSLRQTTAVWGTFSDELDEVYESDKFVSVCPPLAQKREGMRSQDVLLRQASEFLRVSQGPAENTFPLAR